MKKINKYMAILVIIIFLSAIPMSIVHSNVQANPDVSNPLYNVTIHENGLPQGVQWNSTFAGVPHSTTNSQYSVFLQNGTYPLSLNATSYTYPITINSPPSGTGNYQQLLTINDPSQYGINSKGSNIQFASSNGTLLYAWIQNINSTSMQVWVKNYNGSSIIDMQVLPQFENLFSANGYLGEAPQLSSVYGEYFNAPEVFGNSSSPNAWDFSNSSFLNYLNYSSSGNGNYSYGTTGLNLYAGGSFLTGNGSVFYLPKDYYPSNFMMLYGINTTLLGSDSASSSLVEDLEVGLGFYDVAGNGPFVGIGSNSEFSYWESGFSSLVSYPEWNSATSVLISMNYSTESYTVDGQSLVYSPTLSSIYDGKIGIGAYGGGSWGAYYMIIMPKSVNFTMPTYSIGSEHIANATSFQYYKISYPSNVTVSGSNLIINITISESTIGIGVSQNPIAVGTSVKFYALVNNGTNNISYAWQINGQSFNTQNATYNFTLQGNYPIQLAVNESGLLFYATVFENVYNKIPTHVFNITVFNIPEKYFKSYNVSLLIGGFTIYGSSYLNGKIKAEVQGGGSYNIKIHDLYNVSDTNKQFQVIQIDNNTTINFAQNGTTYYGNSILTSGNNIFKPVDVSIIYGVLMLLSAFILIRFGNYQIFTIMMMVEVFLGYILTIKYFNLELIGVILFIVSIMFVKRLTGDIK